MNKEEKRINYLLDTIIESPSMQADELRKRIKRLFKTIEKQNKVIDKMAEHIEKNDEEECSLPIVLCKDGYCVECIKKYFYKEIEK